MHWVRKYSIIARRKISKNCLNLALNQFWNPNVYTCRLKVILKWVFSSNSWSLFFTFDLAAHLENSKCTPKLEFRLRLHFAFHLFFPSFLSRKLRYHHQGAPLLWQGRRSVAKFQTTSPLFNPQHSDIPRSPPIEKIHQQAAMASETTATPLRYKTT